VGGNDPDTDIYLAYIKQRKPSIVEVIARARAEACEADEGEFKHLWPRPTPADYKVLLVTEGHFVVSWGWQRED
jgi:hypothetical protein